MTDTAVNRESGWVGFVDIVMRLATFGVPNATCKVVVGKAEAQVAC